MKGNHHWGFVPTSFLLAFLACRAPQVQESDSLQGSRTPTRAATNEEPQSARPGGEGDQAKIYTAYNLWYEKPHQMYCINYKRGAKIPAGTEVSEVRSGRKLFRKHPAITFITAKDRQQYIIYFKGSWHPGLTVHEFKNRLFTPQSFDELTEGLTDSEITCVKNGEIVRGVSKRAVLIIRGYPPKHKTSTLENNTWYYWDNRFNKKAFHFDGDGKLSYAED